MRLVVSEKNIAAKRIAEILATGKPTSEKDHTTPVYRFKRDGEEWVSIGLKGHIMRVDFPKEADSVDDPGETVDVSKWSLASLPTVVRAPVLKLPAEKGIIQSLKSLAKKADEVIIATDFDREGELIGADARDIIRASNPAVPVHRVRFSAITNDEIRRAFSEPGDISEELAEAGETRQDIDLIWGAVLTRFLTLAHQTKTRRPFGDVLSAGRVQTPTLKLIADREAERRAFVPEDYWTVRGSFEAQGTEFSAPHATARFGSAAEAEAVMAAVSGAKDGRVTEVERSRRQQNAPAPFNTTSLMAAAASEGLTPSRTMNIAESLYMRGLVSYPRVDNTVYPPSLDLGAILRALSDVPAYREHAKRLLSAPLHPTRGPKETTDHPPIHPTGAADPESMRADEWKLYNLIARRFMATMSGPATIEGTRVDIDVSGERFVAKGDVLVSPGFRAIYPYGQKREEELPAMSEGDTVAFAGAELAAKQTQPPARYSQGKLIQEMEKLGLGTKATRHDIIQGLYDRHYISNDPAEITNKGQKVIEALSAHAGRITSPDMTSELEAEMDAIANGRERRTAVVDHSRSLLADIIATLLPIAEDVGEELKSATDEDAKVGQCPKCEKDLSIRFSPKNKSYFVGCTGYPDCDVTFALPKNAKFAAVEELCPVCGTPQVKVMKFKSRPKNMCLNPDCESKKGPEIEISVCAREVKGCEPCGGKLMVAYSKFGNRFVRCENFDMTEHQVSYPLPQSGEIEAIEETCDACGAPKVIIHNKKGPWKICIDPECPAKVKKAAAAGGRKRPAARRASTKRPAAKRKAGGSSST